MWKPETEKKSLARMTGHQQLVNDVKFRYRTLVIRLLPLFVIVLYF